MLRVPFNADFTGVDKIVDEGLKKQIQEHVKRAGNFKKAFEEGIFLLDKNGKPHGNKIRHIRVFKDGEVKEPLAIKKQTNLSDKEYKQHYWAANGENIICAYYKNDSTDKNGKLKKDRELEIINLFDAAQLKKFNLVNAKGQLQIFRKDKNNQVIIDANGNKQTPYVILKAGMKVIFYDEKIEELKQQENEKDSDYNKRLSLKTYKIVKFAGSQITFLHHLDSRDEKQHLEAFPENGFFKKDNKGKDLTYGKRGKNGFTEKIDDYLKYNNGQPWHKLLYTKDWLDFAVEGDDFEIKMDGTIEWLNYQ